MAKVTIIGATGNVGMFAAHAISAIPHVSEILLYGRDGRESLLKGITQDLIDSFAARGTDIETTGQQIWRMLPDLISLSSLQAHRAQPGRIGWILRWGMQKSLPRLPGQSVQCAPDTKILMVTNPVDVMTCVALKYSGLKPSQVFGLGTHLDSMRLKSLIASYFHVHVSEVHTRIIGEHGDSMVPLWSATTIGGIKISNLPEFSHLPVQDIITSVKCSGQQIIQNKGSTVYGPGEAIASLVRTILSDENRILTVSTYIKTEVHGIGNVCIGVPARMNRDGVFPITIRLDESEVIAFRESVEKIREITRAGHRKPGSPITGKIKKTTEPGFQFNVTSIISARSTPGMALRDFSRASVSPPASLMIAANLIAFSPKPIGSIFMSWIPGSFCFSAFFSCSRSTSG